MAICVYVCVGWEGGGGRNKMKNFKSSLSYKSQYKSPHPNQCLYRNSLLHQYLSGLCAKIWGGGGKGRGPRAPLAPPPMW